MRDEEQSPPLPPPSPFAPARPPQRSQLPSSQRFPTWKHALVMLFGSGALTASSCVGCQVALDIGGGGGAVGEAIPVVLAILILAGLVGTFVGVLFVLMRVLHALFGKKDESETQ
jgi:hypothetical protein